MTGIYGIKNVESGKLYVGQAHDVEKRLSHMGQVPWNKGKTGGIAWNKGKTASKEEKANMSLAQRKRWDKTQSDFGL